LLFDALELINILWISEKYLSFIKVKLGFDISDTQPRLDPLSRLELSLSPEVTERLEEAVELLGYSSSKELVTCIIRRFLDRYRIPEISAR